MPELILHPGREKSLHRRHPWIFSGAVAAVEGQPQPGQTVTVRDADGNFLAQAAYSPASQIRGRVWCWDEDTTVDAAYFRRQLATAIEARQRWKPALRDPLAQTGREDNAARLVHGESDSLPGLILDQYGDTLVAQYLSAGAELWRETLADLAIELTGASRVFERSDVEVRSLEGLSLRLGWQRGRADETRTVVAEAGLKFLVDFKTGHKTGFYLDQSLNRERVRALGSLRTASAGQEVLDCFCYTGGFSANALAGGARQVTAVDASAEALAAARENIALNHLPQEKIVFMEGDVFQMLRKFRDSRRSFDLIVLDPPKFAQTASQAEQAARGYKDINLLAFKLLRPGGLLVTFSCSGGVSAELFQKIVAGAALDAGVTAQVVEFLHQAPDHPIGLNFPEGAYLKGLVIKVPHGL